MQTRFLEWILELLPRNDNPASVRRWRWNMGISILVFWAGITTAWWWAPFLLQTKAEAQRTDQSLSEISSTVKELSISFEEFQRQRVQEERQRSEDDRQKAIRDIRQQLYTTQRDACQASNPLRRELTRQVAELRSSYTVLTGTEYIDIPCT